ncbi:MAG TPA: glycoside hydrolase family 3 C-terminal domain-containing protein, partial [Tepidisphaeraceae bacterium]|nr:glycoside hydrolase family 3 C-terminal domain-containing protein [Tepidisphaeraceae bacterium]
ATWDTALIQKEGDVVSTEARAKYNDFVATHKDPTIFHSGLSFYSPNINIVRDPRWGRGQETYGEDPFLTGQIAVAYIKGLQGNNPKYDKTIACAKHYAVHDGPEIDRHFMDLHPSRRDLYETYLPAFEAAVRQGHVGSVMGAYSALYGVPDCSNSFLLKDILRNTWGFNGFVISDGGAIWDVWAQHKYVATAEAAAAVSVKAGCDMCSGNSNPPAEVLQHSNEWTPDTLGWLDGGEAYKSLPKAVKEGLINEKQIDVAVRRALMARFRLGLFDPPSMVPWSKITIADNNTPAHQALAEKVAEESIVLLKNDGLLPLDRGKIKSIAVIGPNAISKKALLGNYHGQASDPVTILNGIKAIAGPEIKMKYVRGCPLALRIDGSNRPTSKSLSDAVAAAKAADVVIYVGGLDGSLESEQVNSPGDVFIGFNRGDRKVIELPQVQEDLIKALCATGKPVIFINCSGSAIAMKWEAAHVPAIIQAWYPGENGGIAVAKILFGQVNPSGRLPITFYASTKDLPPFDDYSMANRTYRYFDGKPLYAFGHGLSYTQFKYSQPKLGAKRYTPDSTIEVSFTLKNSGQMAGDEVAQVYLKHRHSKLPQAKLTLCAFTRDHLGAGSSANVSVNVPADRFRYWNPTKRKYVIDAGEYELLIGSASDDIRLRVPVRISASQD